MKSFSSIIFVLATFLVANSLSDRQLSARIVGGKFAKRGQFPYQVGLDLVEVPNAIRNWCGGSLLSKNYVLSAAHCLIIKRYKIFLNEIILIHEDQYQRIWSLDAYIGGNDLNKKEQYQVIHVPANPNFIIHPEYNAETDDNDISLIHLPEPAVLNEFSKIISLPSPYIGDLVGKIATVTGYGVTNDTTQKSSDILKYVKLKIMENEKCYKLDQRKLCTKTINQKNACSGDSGGPLVLKNENRKNIVVGIVSYGFPLCEKSLSAYFTRVSQYLDWIKENMK